MYEKSNSNLLGNTNNTSNILPHKTKKMKVYLINTKNLTEDEVDIDLTTITDNAFIKIAERSGDVYTERGFENAYNSDDFDNSNTYIRFLDV